MIVAKLNPSTKSHSGGTIAVAKINYPGFQEIADFISAGSEPAFSAPINGDTDKEFIVEIFSQEAAYIYLRLNNDSTADIYGRQYLANAGGTISAARTTNNYMWTTATAKSLQTFKILTPTGLIKIGSSSRSDYDTGTTMASHLLQAVSYNSTANTTSINFVMQSGNFTAGTRITVYARRSNV